MLEKLDNQAEPDANNLVNMQIQENKLVFEDLNAANRKFQLNKARLDYLEVKLCFFYYLKKYKIL